MYLTSDVPFFYKDAKRWTTEYPDVSANTRRSRAKHIVNVYIKPHGVFAINVSSAISKSLLAILEEDIDTPPDFFTPAINEIQDLLERGALLRFHAKDRVLGNASSKQLTSAGSAASLHA